MTENAIATDPRVDPRLKAIFANIPVTHLPDVPDRETLLNLPPEALGVVGGSEGPDPAIFEAAVPSDGLVIERIAVTSQPDGNVIYLQFIRPDGDGPYPCVYYSHGGGMMMGSCFDPAFSAFGRQLAHQGVAVAMVDFRNCLAPSSAAEVAPYPASLNDCVSGLRWVSSHADDLRIDPARIILCGESGGANLAIANALRLKREGELGLISGIYVMCPYLAGNWPGGPGTSADENASILMDARTNFGAVAYGIEQLEARNPLAWPAFAAEEDVAGFPPTVVNVNECDPLRDDGVNFYRLLLRAGVAARGKIVLGTVHGTEALMMLACPEIGLETAREIAAHAARGDGS